MEILRRDPGTGIQCGVNDLGKLFLGDVCCWYNLDDTPENREKLLADYVYSVEQRQAAQEPPKVMAAGEWMSVDYKFQVNAAHVSAIYDELDASLKRYGRRTDGGGIEVASFLCGVSAALRVIAANVTRVEDWCGIQTAERRYFAVDE